MTYINPKTYCQEEKGIFYARAHTERRGFEIGVMALKILKNVIQNMKLNFWSRYVKLRYSV